MRAFPVKLPLAAHARLHLQAERLHCYPSALARARYSGIPASNHKARASRDNKLSSKP